MNNIVVVFGGVSCEHDISIITGIQVVNNLVGYNIYPIYISKSGIWYYSDKYRTVEDVITLKASECFISSDGYLVVKSVLGRYKKLVHIDGVFVALHGLNGEDGALAGLCNISGINCFNPQILPSALLLDKVEFKNYLSGLNLVRLVKYVGVSVDQSFDEVRYIIDKKKLAYPLIVKPANLGSSIGIQIVKTLDDLNDKLTCAFKFDKKVIIEELVSNISEYNIAILKDKNDLIISSVEEPRAGSEILSYDDKYLNGEKVEGMQSLARIFPADISDELKKEIEDSAAKVYKQMNLSGVVRFDFIYQKDTNVLYLNEINTIPGSYANYLFDNLTFEELLNKMIKNTYFEKNKEKELIRYFESSVLKNADLSIKK